MYVYKKSETLLWTVGYYDPSGQWQPESDHDIREEAAARIHYLNGGGGAMVDSSVAEAADLAEAADQVVDAFSDCPPVLLPQAAAMRALKGKLGRI